MSTFPEKVLLDTNLLLLWLVARTDPTLLFGYKRVQMFSYDDIKLLRMIMAACRQIVSTPHVLAEVSNFLDQAPTHRRSALLHEFKRYILECVEVYLPASELSRRVEFDGLGLTDTGLAQLSSEALILSMDYQLTGQIKAKGGNAVNFNDLRLSRRVTF